jgi:1-acyl-sn-glycerol-3-phosphate acyltransferase
MRNALLFVIRWIFKILSRVEIVGLENIPSQGGAILAANHMSLIDPALVRMVISRRDVSSLVADSYKNNLPIRWLVDAMGGIWINRQQADLHALRQARDFLIQGGLLGIAPEGTRSKVGSLLPAKTGTAYLADKAGVPIVPAAISGTEKAFRELAHLRRPRLRIEYGEPFGLPPLERKDRDAGLQRNTDEIMLHIAAMLPPQYWGAYRDHPRLINSLAQQRESGKIVDARL